MKFYNEIKYIIIYNQSIPIHMHQMDKLRELGTPTESSTFFLSPNLNIPPFVFFPSDITITC